MIPNRRQIERWAEPTSDGYVRIPASCWPELLWCITQCERTEKLMEPIGAKALAYFERIEKRAENWAQGREPLRLDEGELADFMEEILAAFPTVHPIPEDAA